MGGGMLPRGGHSRLSRGRDAHAATEALDVVSRKTAPARVHAGQAEAAASDASTEALLGTGWERSECARPPCGRAFTREHSAPHLGRRSRDPPCPLGARFDEAATDGAGGAGECGAAGEQARAASGGAAGGGGGGGDGTHGGKEPGGKGARLKPQFSLLKAKLRGGGLAATLAAQLSTRWAKGERAEGEAGRRPLMGSLLPKRSSQSLQDAEEPLYPAGGAYADLPAISPHSSLGSPLGYTLSGSSFLAAAPSTSQLLAFPLDSWHPSPTDAFPWREVAYNRCALQLAVHTGLDEIYSLFSFMHMAQVCRPAPATRAHGADTPTAQPHRRADTPDMPLPPRGNPPAQPVGQHGAVCAPHSTQRDRPAVGAGLDHIWRRAAGGRHRSRAGRGVPAPRRPRQMKARQGKAR